MISPSDKARALQLYRLAWALVKAKGATVKFGVVTFRLYKAGDLTIHYLPKSGHLDIWYHYKVLTVDSAGRGVRVARYVPGEDWEDELEMAAKVAA